MPAELTAELVQLVKESLSNALRHSGAGEIAIRVGCGQNQVVMSVSDDGRGFDAELVAGIGFGLANMADRVAAAGGSFRVDTSEVGTTVRASFPLSAED